jgi:Uma2 family endonuclease
MADGNSPLRLSAQEFLDWEEQQDTKYELVEGKVFAMSGAKNRHEDIKGNLYFHLRSQLPAAGPCKPYGSDTKVAIPNGNYRYPDLVIDCTQPRNLDSVFAETPTVIFEILSPSNRWYDRANKIADYQLLPACRHIIIVWSTAARIEVLSRLEDDSWARTAEVYEGREAQVVLAAIDIKIPLEDVYRGFSDADLPD